MVQQLQFVVSTLKRRDQQRHIRVLLSQMSCSHAPGVLLHLVQVQRAITALTMP